MGLGGYCAGSTFHHSLHFARWLLEVAIPIFFLRGRRRHQLVVIILLFLLRKFCFGLFCRSWLCGRVCIRGHGYNALTTGISCDFLENGRRDETNGTAFVLNRDDAFAEARLLGEHSVRDHARTASLLKVVLPLDKLAGRCLVEVATDRRHDGV